MPNCEKCLDSFAIITCARCRHAAYCSVDCQAAAWSLHKHMCVPHERPLAAGVLSVDECLRILERQGVTHAAECLDHCNGDVDAAYLYAVRQGLVVAPVFLPVSLDGEVSLTVETVLGDVLARAGHTALDVATALVNFPWEPVLAALRQRDASAGIADIREFCRFLFMKTAVADVTGTLMYTPPCIQRVWQTCMQNADQYLELCEQVLLAPGRVFCFMPMEQCQLDEHTRRARYNRTITAYTKVFGIPPPDRQWSLGSPIPAKIILLLRGNGLRGMNLRVYVDMLILRVIAAFCSSQTSFSRDQLLFTFNGVALDLAATVAACGLTDGDQIDVQVQL